jgi:NAD(P)-dependent dehydrogenase (short-subunit alcohol dehydrogenase family)
MMHAPAPFAPVPAALLAGRRLVVLGSGSGLGRAVALAADAAGAEVLGIDDTRGFEGLSALFRADLTDPAALDAAVAALPEAIDGLIALPDLGAGDPAQALLRGLLAPRQVMRALAPKLSPGAGIVLRAAQPHANRAAHVACIRAALALRWGDVAGFVPRWGLHVEPGRTSQIVGWACQALALTQPLRINCVLPASPDGRLPPERVAATGYEAAAGTELAARAALYLVSPLAAGITGATIAADGGLSASISTNLDGL